MVKIFKDPKSLIPPQPDPQAGYKGNPNNPIDPSTGKPSNPITPSASAYPQPDATQLKTDMAPRNMGIDVKTGQQVPVITMQGPKEQTFQAAEAASPTNLPALQQFQREQQTANFQNQPIIQPQPLGPDANKPQLNALDVGGVIGGAIAGGTAGASLGLLAGPAAPVVSPVLGVLGAIGGATTAYFYDQTTDRKQDVKVGYAKFRGATSQMQKITNSVNAGQMSQMQAQAEWENNYQRVLQAQRDLKIAASGMFGEKLARSLDEQAKLETWLQYYDQYKLEFNASLYNPNPSRITTNIEVPNEPDTTQ